MLIHGTLVVGAYLAINAAISISQEVWFQTLRVVWKTITVHKNTYGRFYLFLQLALCEFTYHFFVSIFRKLFRI